MIISLLDTVPISTGMSVPTQGSHVPLISTTQFFNPENAGEGTQTGSTALSRLLSRTFSVLDGDRDGYLTCSDFSSQGTFLKVKTLVLLCYLNFISSLFPLRPRL